MGKETKYLTKNAKEGDIYYFLIDKKYYFLKIIKTATRLLETKFNEKITFFRYFLIVFEKSYSKLPNDKIETDFVNIYQIKHKPKNALLYTLYEDRTVELKIDERDALYEKKEMFDLHYWKNEGDKNEYCPKIITENVSPIEWTANENGVQISPTPAKMGYIFGRIESDLKHKNKKLQKITPKYFLHWVNEIDTDIIIKMEKIFDKYLSECNKNGIEKPVKKCIKSINKLDENEHFIGTIEREDIIAKLFEITKPYNIDEKIMEGIIEENRDW